MNLVNTYFERFGLPGYYAGACDPSQLWNGWSIPYFTKEQALVVMEAIEKEWPEDMKDITPGPVVIYNSVRDVFYTYHSDYEEYEAWPAVTINGQKYYSIGGQAWTWMEKAFYKVARIDTHDPVDTMPLKEQEALVFHSEFGECNAPAFNKVYQLGVITSSPKAPLFLFDDIQSAAYWCRFAPTLWVLVCRCSGVHPKPRRILANFLFIKDRRDERLLESFWEHELGGKEYGPEHSWSTKPLAISGTVLAEHVTPLQVLTREQKLEVLNL